MIDYQYDVLLNLATNDIFNLLAACAVNTVYVQERGRTYAETK